MTVESLISSSSVVTQAPTSFKTEVNQLGPKFQDGMFISLSTVPELLDNGALQAVQLQVEESTGNFTFAENGFEFHDFSKRPLGAAIQNLANNLSSREHRVALRGQVEAELAQWGRREGIPFTKAICVDSVVRNTREGRFGAVHLVHIDFPETDIPSTLKGHAEWKEKVSEKLGPLSEQEYESLHVKKMVNVWMCLDEHLEAEPLALMDTSSLEPSRVHPYEAERVGGGTFPSSGVLPAKNQRWVTKQNMTLGEGIIFNSCKTPHTAVTKPDQGDKVRNSVECRVLFV